MEIFKGNVKMKTISGLIIACLVAISYNIFAGVSASGSGYYNSSYAERVAIFAIVMVPLVLIFAAMVVFRMFRRKKP